MSNPAKLTCEITAKGYCITVTDDKGKEMFRSESKMKSSGTASGGKDATKCAALADFDHLAEEIDDVALSLFGIACELHSIHKHYA